MVRLSLSKLAILTEVVIGLLLLGNKKL